jgi:hypothetical protein
MTNRLACAALPGKPGMTSASTRCGQRPGAVDDELHLSRLPIRRRMHQTPRYTWQCHSRRLSDPRRTMTCVRFAYSNNPAGVVTLRVVTLRVGVEQSRRRAASATPVRALGQHWSSRCHADEMSLTILKGRQLSSQRGQLYSSPTHRKTCLVYDCPLRLLCLPSLSAAGAAACRLPALHLSFTLSTGICSALAEKTLAMHQARGSHPRHERPPFAAATSCGSACAASCCRRG